jgi:hypothetical protein
MTGTERTERIMGRTAGRRIISKRVTGPKVSH